MRRALIIIALVLILAIAAFILVLQEPPAEDTMLAQNGIAKAVVVVAEDAGEPEKHAASELVSFLNQITGGEFELLDSAQQGCPRLLVGPDAAKLADPSFTVEGLGAEGLVIRSVGDDLILAGGRPRGTLYAVYTFLEDYLGCRWWTSTESTIPKNPDLTVGTLDVRFVPVLEYREPFWFGARDGDWAVRNKSNGNFARLDAKHGGKITFAGFVHTFFELIPPAKYFKDHPEWFSENDGKRGAGQLCLINEEMRKEFVKNLKARLRQNPSAVIASVSHNDDAGNCRCPKCAAIDEREGSPAGSLLHFVNAVAEDIEEEFPHVAISTLAYTYTRKPPKFVGPRHNVIVRLCINSCSPEIPLADEANRKVREYLENWAKKSNRIYIWNYTTNFRHYMLPHPNLYTQGPDIKLFVQNNAKGIFEQGCHTTPGGEMAKLRAWLQAKMLWDPSLDPQKVMDEFINGYYETAAPHIRDYINVTHQPAASDDEDLSIYGSPLAPGFLSLEKLSQGLIHLKAAEASVADDPRLLRRVRCEKMPVLYDFIVDWTRLRAAARSRGVTWPVSEDPMDVFGEFKGIAKIEKVRHVAEMGDRGLDWLENIAMLNRARRPAGPPPGCEKLPRDRWVDFQDYSFYEIVKKAWMELTPDPDASDGVAARMPGDQIQWAVQLWFNYGLGDLKNKNLRCRLAVKVECTGTEGAAFSYGIYDEDRLEELANKVVPVSHIKDDKYHVYDLGVYNMNNRKWIWAAPMGNAANVKAVWVDRIWLVEE